jgi:hypothetical protein
MLLFNKARLYSYKYIDFIIKYKNPFIKVKFIYKFF